LFQFTESAQSDLLEAWLFLTEEDLPAADRLLDQIDREIATLLLQPLMGRARPELASGLRSWPTSTAYVLFYLAGKNNFTVVRVLHHARDLRQFGFEG
jgi:toxin ParE1/3/4